MPNICSAVYFLHSLRRFNPRHSLRPVTQASVVHTHASCTLKHTCRPLCLLERTCFQWKPESALPRGPGVDHIFSEVEREKDGVRISLVVHQFSSKGGKANIKQKRVQSPAVLGRAPVG